ncbi:RES family NAD+ phosphorylase [Luteolibacter flavescens]|uniref:RES family NAD+ phosphorylase n=1 Tax=Luteolibacter flavescens TaxID=1859460 RepID=A0ABT3FMT5_9BACT|nr:RES family NAD+ phosphorylase [Luteolibacter flavescens]MCW1884885.1 RES family NAD+ phosphorylase [Luteolibacter flavescens]
MILHPLSASLVRRIAAVWEDACTAFTGECFRFVKPTYSRTADLFAGKGALHANGRWLLQGVAPATYTSLEPETALAESLAAARYFGFPLSSATPAVLVTARMKLARVIDLRDGSIRRRLRVSEKSVLECDWRSFNREGDEAITQAVGRAALLAGFEGMLVPSAARAGGGNLIVFPGNLASGSTVRVVKEVEWPGS